MGRGLKMMKMVCIDVYPFVGLIGLGVLCIYFLGPHPIIIFSILFVSGHLMFNIGKSVEFFREMERMEIKHQADIERIRNRPLETVTLCSDLPPIDIYRTK